jgi:mRNA-degrading endonuclease RelE of RelBE toxin-antitoxin system
VKSFTTRRFREAYASLPESIQARAKKAYALFRENPFHPGLRFKKLDESSNIYSARIGLGYRVMGRVEEETVIWFWIGSHADYDRLT